MKEPRDIGDACVVEINGTSHQGVIERIIPDPRGKFVVVKCELTGEHIPARIEDLQPAKHPTIPI